MREGKEYENESESVMLYKCWPRYRKAESIFLFSYRSNKEELWEAVKMGVIDMLVGWHCLN